MTRKFLRFSAVNAVGSRVRFSRFEPDCVSARGYIRSLRNLGFTSILPIPLRSGKAIR